MANRTDSLQADLPGVSGPDIARLLSEDFTPRTESGAPLPLPDIVRSISDTEITEFQSLVRTYYRYYGRDLPWRHTTNPYHIFVSEVMLQQTQAVRVIPKYEQFLHLFPDFRTLADTPLKNVLAAWSGLGYNRRARYLREAAAIIRDVYHETLPREPEILATLPGIGKATACSITAFAFDRPVVFLETNVRRVHLHFFFRDMDGIGDSDLLPLVERTLYRPAPREWYNAVMDVGTLLKQHLPNPNQRSRHHKKQAPFVDSNRQIRGGIIRLLAGRDDRLTGGDGASVALLAKRLDADPGRVQVAAEELAAEGFLYNRKGVYYIVE